MTKYLILAILFTFAALTGCGKGPQGEPGVTVQVPAPAAPESVTQQLVDAENEYRLSLGQTALTQGLSCTVQAVASGQWLSSASPGYNAGQGVVVLTGTSYSYLMANAFNQPDAPGGSLNSVLPAPIQPSFASINYRISCTGQIVATETGYYSFSLNSDDGSILTVDGAQVINNDGNHGMTERQGLKMLRAGVHTFSLQYAQTGGGNFGLVLKANGDVVPGSAFYH